MKQSIVVTGAAGFIGSHLCEALLLAGHVVTGIDNFDPFYNRNAKEQNLTISLQHPNFSFIEGDAGDKMLLNSITATTDTVVHLAAKAGVQPSLMNADTYIQANIQVTNALLEWMKEKEIKKLVFASSSSVYGNNTKIPFEESDPVAEPISPYAFTKRSCELMNYTYHHLYQLDVINLRFFTVYGERQRPDLAIHKFVKLIQDEKPITLYGDGKSSRDYTYFTDTVKGILSAIDHIHTNNGVFETINLGNNQPVYLNVLIETIADVLGKRPKIIYEEMKPGDVNVTYANINKANQLLGYAPSITLRSGIENFIAWYNNRPVSF